MNPLLMPINYGFGRFNNGQFHVHGHIMFVQKNSPKFEFCSKSQSQKSFYLYLLDQNLQFIPRKFTITTNNGSYHFNTEFLKDTSPVISKIIEEDQNNLQFHIDIKDEENVMKKIEDLYLGKTIEIEIKDLFVVQKIIESLNILCVPHFMLPNNSQATYYTIPAKAEIEMDKSSLSFFLNEKIQKTFTIISNKKEYKCNLIGVYSSNVIRELIEKDPSLNQYVYNSDSENENDELKQICNFFNFEKVQITVNNMDSLKKIAEKLQISFILEDINNFIDNYENAVQLIDDQKTIIETNDEIFHWLYDIKNLTIEAVKDLIVNSIWVHTEENIQELVACILQVIRVGFKLHPYLIDLLLLLDQSKNETNDLYILIPYFIKQMKLFFYNNKFYCSFFYRMTQKGLITIDEIINHIQIIDSLYSSDQQKFKSSRIDLKHTPKYHNIVTLWFFPELNKIKKFHGDELFPNQSSEIKKLFRFFFPNNIERFIKIRESGEPDDELTKAILYDDVDTLQLILSKSAIDINTSKLPLNLYEIFDINDEMSFINYAAENGSIKCFKYLLLNHAKMDELTFGCAVYGGNIEIIRTVNQYFHNDIKIIIHNDESTNDPKNNYNKIEDFTRLESCEYTKDHLLNPIVPAIMTHQSDLFDWILEQKYICKGIAGNLLLDLAIISVKNGNAHSFIECIDKGLDLRSFSDNKQVTESFIYCSSFFGFYRIIQLIFSLTKKTESKKVSKIINPLLMASSVLTGNLYIFEFVDKLKNLSMFYGQCLVQAINNDYISIVKYIVEKDFKPSDNLNIISIFSAAISKKNPKPFNYIKDRFNYQDMMKKNEITLSDLIIILCEGCVSGNFEAVQELTEFILQNEPKSDFTSPFIRSISFNHDQITQYFIDKNVLLNYNVFLKNLDVIACGNLEIITKLTDKASPEIRMMLLQGFLNNAIEKNNKNLVEFLLTKNPPNSKSLFAAVNSHNVEIVDLILSHNSKPSFINQITALGTALNIAVCNNDLPIVQRLLSLPGIDPNLYEKNNHTPLISAIINLNLDMINAILDFYGDSIQSQMWQIDDALKEILKKLSGNFNIPKTFIKKPQFDDSDYYDDDYDDDVPINVENDDEIMNTNDFDFLSNNQSQIFNVLNRLMKIENIDLNVHVHKYTLLTYACETNEVELLRILLKSDKVNVNSYAPTNGNTPLMIAIEKKNFEIANILIESPKVNINLKNYNGQTALTIAVTQQLQNVIDILVNSSKFDPEESCLDYAFFISDGKISNQLWSIKRLNVNYKYINQDKMRKINDEQYDDIDFGLIGSPLHFKKDEKDLYLYETTLIHAVNQKKLDMIDLIINHSSFDPIQSQVTAAIFVSVFHNEIDIFRKLLKLVDNNVNIYSQTGESLLSYSIMNESHDITTEILNNDSFDSVKSDLFSAFCNAAYLNLDVSKQMIFRNYEADDMDLRALIDEMNELCEYDEVHDHLINFDQLLPNGKSFFTSISCFVQNTEELVEFFLEHNVDPNLPDKEGVYPLEYAIQQEDFEFFSALANSPKIDFSIRLNKVAKYDLKNDTFLHLAIMYNEERIVEEIIGRNLVDINATNNLGETPLIKAVMHKKIFNIIQLFNSDDLDYFLLNNEGKDALRISRDLQDDAHPFPTIGIQTNSGIINNIHPEDKKRYLLKIIENFSSGINESIWPPIPPF